MAVAETKPNGSNGYERWVISELAELKDDLRFLRREQLPRLETEITNARLDIRALQTRAQIAGGIAGTLFGAVAAAIVSLAVK